MENPNPHASQNIKPVESNASIELVISSLQAKVLDYSLLLASQQIDHWIDFREGKYILCVEEQDQTHARSVLALYLNENRHFYKAESSSELDLLISPLLYLIVPIALYFWQGIDISAQWLEKRGRADADLILNGQWWRTFTALTLHADAQHLLGNLLSGYFILNLLGHRLRIGTLMLCTTLLAALANFAVALTSTPNHASLGFSTAIFTALGLLAACETQERWGVTFRLRKLTPLFSAFFIAVLIGLGENADIKAHFYGFGLGVLGGSLFRLMPSPIKTNAQTKSKQLSTQSMAMQGLLVGACYALFVAAWMLAAR